MKQPELGQKILELRQKKGFTQEELVEQCNISVRTIQRIEAGEVTPRIFTVKTILEALDFPLEEFQESKVASTFKNLMLLKVDSSKQATFLSKQLLISWISGIVFFVIGFIEFPADFARLYEDEMLFATPVYIIVKLIALVSFVLFMRGFVLLGNIFNNYFLKIVAFIFIAVIVMFYAFDFVSIFVDVSENYESVLIAESLTFGIIGILQGIAVIRLSKIMGNIAMVTGIFEIVTYVLFATVILAFAGFVLLVPTIILEIILLYKAMQMIKEKQKELQ